MDMVAAGQELADKEQVGAVVQAAVSEAMGQAVVGLGLADQGQAVARDRVTSDREVGLAREHTVVADFIPAKCHPDRMQLDQRDPTKVVH
jgi:hypothetical protein